jgi:nicotinamide riboside kinase
MVTSVINLFGGPGSGCSTMRARIFSELKYKQINCEEVLEYVKEIIYDESSKKIDNEILIFGHQYHKMKRLNEDVDVIVTDGPLVHSAFYSQNSSQIFQDLVLEEFHKFKNYNFFLDRNHPYSEVGRIQDESEADRISENLKSYLERNKITFSTIYSSPHKASEIGELVQNSLKKQNL